ncbi:TetR/AcrR family transcriptional regulator [Paenibacillus elgii]|uniref:TetR/AcrR family transcriptional regulator n=1 Tax=Paenibacillus elgii TaxID=189691 RepID=UPI0020408C78|nr:TetR/AcrR family transcriptional regulator [Paenibacillus elgii]MCM3268675.1 TetR/AcrR family transcriptional regulator [Paenibacillus elgii]
MKQPDKKQKIIEAATELFLHSGVRRTTLSKIAEKAGIGKGTIYYYYEDKTQILMDCYMRHVNQMRSKAFAELQLESDVLVRLRSILGYLSAEVHQDPFVSTLFEEYKEFRLAEIEKCFVQSEEAAVQLIGSLIREGQQQGHYAQVPLPLTAFMLVKIIFSYELDYPKTEQSDQDLKQLLRHMLRKRSDD